MGNILLNLGEFIQSEKTAAICCRFQTVDKPLDISLEV